MACPLISGRRYDCLFSSSMMPCLYIVVFQPHRSRMSYKHLSILGLAAIFLLSACMSTSSILLTTRSSFILLTWPYYRGLPPLTVHSPHMAVLLWASFPDSSFSSHGSTVVGFLPCQFILLTWLYCRGLPPLTVHSPHMALLSWASSPDSSFSSHGSTVVGFLPRQFILLTWLHCRGLPPLTVHSPHMALLSWASSRDSSFSSHGSAVVGFLP